MPIISDFVLYRFIFQMGNFSNKLFSFGLCLKFDSSKACCFLVNTVSFWEQSCQEHSHKCLKTFRDHKNFPIENLDNRYSPDKSLEKFKKFYKSLPYWKLIYEDILQKSDRPASITLEFLKLRGELTKIRSLHDRFYWFL